MSGGDAQGNALSSLASGRRRLAARLYDDSSYGVFDAMVEMGALAQRHVLDVVPRAPAEGLWASGSLGRCEMLPNSDLDLFVVRDGTGPRRRVSVGGFDKVDLADMTLGDAENLLECTLVDGNRIVDGRPLGESTVGDRLRSAVRCCNTPDRQLANLIAEHSYFHQFDFPLKRTALGPDLKYSRGSARVTLFFDFVHRYATSQVPAQRPSRPELEDALETAEGQLGYRSPRRAVELICLVKCAAISAYDATGDPRAKRVSRTALSLIHETCGGRMAAWGLPHVNDLLTEYANARHEIATTVDALVATVLADHPRADAFGAVANAPIPHLAAEGARAAEELPEWRHALLTQAAWLLTNARPGPDLVRALADELMEHPMADAWGALMAIACSPTADDETLRRFVSWLAVNERGAYLTKLVGRNPAASSATREIAQAGHASREVLHQLA